jgi:CheY-like chemotaxis protein
MPEMDGLQMTRIIRKMIDSEYVENNYRFKYCHIWAITAMNEADLEDKIERELLDGVSTKPMTYDKLKQVLKKVT